MFSGKIFKITTTIIIATFIAGYSFYQIKDLSKGPILTISYPHNGETLKEQKVFIQGTVKNASYITLNDRQIFVDENNKFKELILLSNGYNLVKITVKDKFERTKTKELELIYKPLE